MHLGTPRCGDMLEIHAAPRGKAQRVMCMPSPAAPLGPLAAFELTCNALGNTSRVRACEMCSAFGLVCGCGRRSFV